MLPCDDVSVRLTNYRCVARYGRAIGMLNATQGSWFGKFGRRERPWLPPWIVGAGEALDHVAQEIRRSMGLPFAVRLQQQRSTCFAAEAFEPRARFRFRARADGDRDIDRDGPPREAGRKKDEMRSVRPHPLGQRTCRSEPTANEIPARIDRARVVDRAFARTAERAGMPRIDVMVTDPDFQPAVAAGGAITTSSRGCVWVGWHESSVLEPSRIRRRFARLRPGYAPLSRTPSRPASSWVNCQATRPEREPRVVDHSRASRSSSSSAILMPKWSQ